MSKEPLLPEEEQSSIFSTPKTRQEIREEQKEKAKEDKANARALRRELKAAKKEAPADPGTKRTMIWTLGIILGLVVVFIGVMLFVQLRGKGTDEREGSGHFYDTENYPELSAEGIKGAVTEAYYTKNDSLCVKLRLSNGINAAHYMTSLEVKVENEDGKTIASGYTKQIPDGYSIPAEDYNTFTFYITKDFVQIPDDDLDQLSYEITVKGEVDSDALASARATSTTGTTTETTAAG